MKRKFGAVCGIAYPRLEVIVAFIAAQRQEDSNPYHSTARLSRVGQLLFQLRDQMFSQFIHGELVGAGLGVTIVICVGVDVINEGLAGLIGDELKRGYIQASLLHHGLHFWQQLLAWL